MKVAAIVGVGAVIGAITINGYQAESLQPTKLRPIPPQVTVTETINPPVTVTITPPSIADFRTPPNMTTPDNYPGMNPNMRGVTGWKESLV